MQKIYPLPEAVDGHQWDVEPGPGSINTVERRLLVPLDASDSARHVRNHETAHAKITPRHPAKVLAHKYGISMDALQAVEDLRVHRFLKHCGIARAGVLSQPEMDGLIQRCHHSRREVALLLVAGLYTDDYQRSLASLENCVPAETVNEIVQKVNLIDRRLASGRLPFRPIGFRNCTAPAAQLLDALFPADAEGSEGSNDIPKDLLQCEAMQPRSSRKPRWGDLSVHHLPASMTRVVMPKSRLRTFRDEGSALSAPYRLPVDGRVFVRHKRVVGGTVLIDGSGSMRLDDAELSRIVEVAPAATVGIYSGRAKSGKLFVIANRGKAATAEGLAHARCSCGNVVDGPALQWLATQPEPRLWVSDGVVTGINDRVSVDLWAQAALLCRKHRITRVDKAAAVGGFLKAAARSTK